MTAIRPPEFFPSLPVAALLLSAERFVVADTFAYSRQSYQNRTRIRTSAGTGRDAMWLTVPVRKGPPGRPIRSVPLADSAGAWRRAHLRTLAACYNNAPYFAHYAPQIEHLFDAVFSDEGTPPTLGTLTVAAMRWAHRVLASDAEFVVASERPSTPATLVDVWLDVGAAPLLTLPDAATVERAQLPEVAQTMASFEEKPRRQVFDGFVSGCGLLDLVFNYGPAARQVLSEGVRLPA
ncbi:MAG: WbqC family protein [Bacteroidota bacterium]